MKQIIIFAILLFVISLNKAIAQNVSDSASTEIIRISNGDFRWEMHNDADSIAAVLADSFVAVSSTGIRRNKTEYLANIKNTAVVHNSIDIQQTNVSVFGSTAILTGKGIFVVTANDVKSILHLSYMQVFIKSEHEWKMIALQASRLPDQ